jgi:hypothetical protein
MSTPNSYPIPCTFPSGSGPGTKAAIQQAQIDAINKLVKKLGIPENVDVFF